MAVLIVASTAGIGHSPNGNLTKEDLIDVARLFRPYTDALPVYDWYREPDYHDDYIELWNLSHQLSDISQEHFELISVYRIVRDKEYVKWLSSLGLKSAQLTLFGTEEKTNFYTGRKHAYLDILKAIEILLDHHISPRIQVFVNKDNLDNLSQLEKVLENYRESKSVAQNIRLNTPISKIVEEEGNPTSEKLFEKEDYIEWISNRYCRKFFTLEMMFSLKRVAFCRVTNVFIHLTFL